MDRSCGKEKECLRTGRNPAILARLLVGIAPSPVEDHTAEASAVLADISGSIFPARTSVSSTSGGASASIHHSNPPIRGAARYSKGNIHGLLLGLCASNGSEVAERRRCRRPNRPRRRAAQ